VLSATIRDIAIIIVAVQSIVIGVLLAVLVWQIWRLVKIIQIEVMPIIEDTQATVHTVRGTAQFVSNNVVNPVIAANTRATKWRTTSQALMRDLGFGKRTPRPASPVPPPTTPPPATPSPAPGSEPLR
jgi:hypothetical protein